MDRKRLSQVQTTDLSESRVNDDFLFWLKNSGPNYLLAALLVACAYLGWNWWQQRAEAARSQVWDDYDRCTVPSEYIDLAAANGDERGLAILAQVSAGDLYLQSISTGIRFDREPTAADAALDDATRTEWLAAARASYAAAADAAGAQSSTAALALPALFGIAAVDEESGDLAGAKAALERAKALAETAKVGTVAELAQARLDSLNTLANPYPVAPAPIPVPAAVAMPTSAPQPTPTPVPTPTPEVPATPETPTAPAPQ